MLGSAGVVDEVELVEGLAVVVEVVGTTELVEVDVVVLV